MYDDIQHMMANFQPIHDEIFSFFRRIRKIQLYPEKWTRFYINFQIFNTLTQNDLMKLTDYSSGSVSGLIRLYSKQKLLLKQRIPRTHKFLYCLKENSLNFDYPYDKIIKNSQRFRIGLSEEIERLSKIYPIDLCRIVYERINQYLDFVSKREKRLVTESQDHSILKTNSTKKYPYFVFPARNAEQECLPKERDYSPTMILVEAALRGFIEQNNIFNVDEPFKKRLLACVILRECHTQSSLAELLGVSLSTISRNLKSLIISKLIEEGQGLYEGKKVYRMEQVNPPVDPYYVLFHKVVNAWKSKFYSLFLQLTNSENKNHIKKGYSYYYTILNRILHQIK